MEAEANGDGDGDSPARRVLLKHEQLLGWQIMKERAGFGLRVLTGVVGVVAAVLIGSLIWSASQERGLVIEPFSVPPEFAERGVTGQVVASRLLDRLSEMSDQTVSVRAPSTYANNWNGDIKVQIPQTGVSVGELRRYLVEWLGKQTTIGGELYQTPDGLSLIARTGTATATPNLGADERDLDAMIQAAAEQVYAATQPYRYAVYLRRMGDDEGHSRSMEALRTLTRSTDVADRLWAFTALNLSLQNSGDFAGAIEAADAAIAIAPEFNLAHANRGGALASLGRDEEAHQSNLVALRTAKSDGRRFMAEEGLAFSTESWLGGTRMDIGDYRGAIEAFRRSLAIRADDGQNLALIGMAQALGHEPEGARLSFHDLTERGLLFSPSSGGVDDITRAQMAAGIAFANGEWSEIVRQIGGVDRTGVAAADWLLFRTLSHPLLVEALANLGDARRATVIAAGLPLDCYRCVMVRGVAAEAAGDRASADRWFAEAIRQGPSLPFANEERGRARVARGDLDGAEADFREANRRSPNWADPLKGWGDVLMARGDARGALRRYDAALERAPQWAVARTARDRAAA